MTDLADARGHENTRSGGNRGTLPGAVAARDTTLLFSREEWAAFLAGAEDGEFGLR
jgi:hypothetical protein